MDDYLLRFTYHGGGLSDLEVEAEYGELRSACLCLLFGLKKLITAKAGEASAKAFVMYVVSEFIDDDGDKQCIAIDRPALDKQINELRSDNNGTQFDDNPDK